MADRQRQRVYQSESVLSNAGRVFRSVDQMQRYVDRIVESDWWKERSKVEEVFVFLGRKDSSTAYAHPAGSYWYGVQQDCPFITIPPTWAARDTIILHELAHIMVPSVEAHGPAFCTAFIELVTKFMGTLRGRQLRESMDEHGVTHEIGKKVLTTNQIKAAARRVELSEEKRKKMREDAEHLLATIKAMRA